MASLIHVDYSWVERVNKWLTASLVQGDQNKGRFLGAAIYQCVPSILVDFSCPFAETPAILAKLLIKFAIFRGFVSLVNALDQALA